MELARSERKFLINHFGKSLKIINNGHVTVVFVKTSHNRGKIAWSIHSDTDGKFDRKYGEWVALERLFDGGLPVEFWNEEDIMDKMYDISMSVGCVA